MTSNERNLWIDRLSRCFGGTWLDASECAEIATLLKQAVTCPHRATDEEACAECVGAPSDNPDDEVRSVEYDFQHFLSYSGKRGQNEDDLRLAYYAGAGLGY